jgi:uncharacterized protein YecE (DUF72 family)
VTGRLLVGTSGFAYPAWAPRFYRAGLRAGDLLAHYATRLDAVELNNTFYQQPAPAKVATWLAATPPSFRFTVKAQRGGTFSSFTAPTPGLPWLTDPYRAFGERLGCVFFRVPAGKRDDDRLAAFLGAWPRDLPLTMDFGDPSWLVDETFAALASAGAVLCATESADDPDAPDLRRTGSYLYLRLRRHDYDGAALEAWAARLEPFLASGMDAFVFFRHDESGRGPELALELADAVARRRGEAD